MYGRRPVEADLCFLNLGIPPQWKVVGLSGEILGGGIVEVIIIGFGVLGREVVVSAVCCVICAMYGLDRDTLRW